MNFDETLKAQNQELKRLCWTTQYRQAFIRENYGKVHRQYFNEKEMMDFLNHLRSCPTPK